MWFVGVTVGLVLFVTKYRDNVTRGIKNLCQGTITNTCCPSDKIEKTNDNKDKIILKKNHEFKLEKLIILADSLEKSDYAVQQIYCNLTDGVLGFDCEWVNEGPVVLLQLATNNGVCVLFRLGKIGYVPAKLKELLSNNKILKVGVAPFEDGKKLTNDYGCRVFGILDLRSFAQQMKLPHFRGLAALSIHYLGIDLDKDLKVRCSNWNVENLSDEQKTYAANDALASSLIFREMNKQVDQRRTVWDRLVILFKSSYKKKSKNNYFFHNVPQEIIDVKYRELPLKTKNNVINKNVKKKNQDQSKHLTTSSLGPIKVDKLYRNSYLQAPNGDTLCACDDKKAEWYIQKKLGEKVNDNPLIVRLNFEPAGRADGEVGQYYIQIKSNQCVVCGSRENFIKKNIVPREYRKYFPVVMKSHQSHDVLLLCPTCHELSNKNDLELRKELAISCDAPLTRPMSPLSKNHLQRKNQYKSAIKILKVNNNLLPQNRREELELVVSEYHDYQNVREANGTRSRTPSPIQEKLTHGQKVVEYFTNTKHGLVNLEKIWREHFLNEMKPQYLPPFWSVDHNKQRLEIRQIQNRLEPGDAQIAGITR